MEASTLPPRARCDLIKQNIKSAPKCTADTLSLLQQLLGIPTTDNVRHNDALEAKVTERTTDTAARRRVRAAQPRVAAKLAGFQKKCVEKEPTCLPQKDKLVLATEVFNIASKTLSDHLRSTSKANHSTESGPNPNFTPHKRISSSNALQPISPNRRTGSPVKGNGEAPEMRKPGKSEHGILAIADCARLALCSLRDLQSGNNKGAVLELNSQLEQGCCILVGKLLLLGLNDVAILELKRLKRRIKLYLENQGQDGATATRNPRARRQLEEKETLSNLLKVDKLPTTAPLTSLVISFQSHALKAIASEKKASTIRKIVDLLLPSNPFSPANIIIQAHNKCFISEDKASQQLQSLSQVILSLSFAVTSADDTRAASRSRTMSTVALNLQMLSLEVRSLWWKIAGHKYDITKELWQPLARYLTPFARRCANVGKDDFDDIKRAFSRLESTITRNGYDFFPAGPKNGFVSTVLRALGQVAEAANSSSDASKFYTNCIASLSPDQHLLLGICRCKIAQLELEIIRTSTGRLLSKAATAISEAAKCLAVPLKGNQSDLDELVIESSKLKKAAMSFFNALGDMVSGDQVARPGTGTVGICIITYLSGFVRFLSRYVSHFVPSPEAEEDHPLQQRLLKCKNIVLAAIDSVIGIGKLSVIAKRHSWDQIQPVLSDCLTLLTYLSSAQGDSGLAESISSYHVKLSNLYWSRYLRQREQKTESSELLPLLRQSTRLMRTCSAQGKLAGFAGIKLERLATLYSDIGECAKSDKAYYSAITTHIETGVLGSATEDAQSKPMPQIMKDPANKSFALRRVLGQYVRSKWKSGIRAEDVLIDDSTSPCDQRAFLLECQLSSLMEALPPRPVRDETSTFSYCVSTLLSLYPLNAYPLRRFRLIAQILRFCLNNPSHLERDMHDAITTEARDHLSGFSDLVEDSGLSAFTSSILTTLRLSLGFLGGSPHDDDINYAIDSWVLIARSCQDWASILSAVDDPESWIDQIKVLADYLDVRGLWKPRLSVLHVLQHVLGLQGKKDYSAIVGSLSQLGIQYSRLGYSEKAGTMLARAGKLVEEVDISSPISIEWHLAYAEYSLDIANFDKAIEILSAAQVVFESFVDSTSKSSFQTRTIWERLVADAAQIQSRLYFFKGEIDKAVFLAKQAVKLNTRLWSRLEAFAGKRRHQLTSEGSDSEIDLLAAKIEDLTLASSDELNNLEYLEGCVYWSHFGSHCNGLVNLSMMSAHNGLFQDTIYFGEQALKVATAMGGTKSLALIRAKLASQWIQGGHADNGRELMDLAKASSKDFNIDLDMVAFNSDEAMLSFHEEKQDDTLRYLAIAHRALMEISSAGFVESLDPLSHDDTVEAGMSKLSIQAAHQPPAAPKPRQLRVKRDQKVQTTRSRARNATTVEAGLPITMPAMLRLQGNLFRQQAASMLLSLNVDEALQLLEKADVLPKSKFGHLSQLQNKSEHMLAAALQKLTSHAVYCVLPESTISLPAICTSDNANSEHSAPSTSQTKKTPVTRRTKVAVINPKRRPQDAPDEFISMVTNAQELLADVFPSTASYGSTHHNHTTSFSLAQTSMLASATTSKTNLLQAIMAIEHGRNCAFSRERRAIDADKTLRAPVEPLKWPTAEQIVAPLEEMEFNNLVKNYIDILPDSWNVVSLTLGNDRTEFVISKLRANHTPFMLRLPLKRGDSEGIDDEEEFHFEEGKEELLEIIKLANKSAHDSWALADNKSKKEWWAVREGLDNRLRDLLHNIESLWFGGFRGIFSDQPVNPPLLARFVSTFEKILDKHLPSRRQRGRNRLSKPNFHSNVMELFVNLGDAENESDPEDLVMDLLYFVVDILQFHGERNAYDEIDFDMMVVETLDAIKSYREAQCNEEALNRTGHTILILDKELHSFPWESLDCLRTSSVSRMPSLQSLREKILQMRNDEIANEDVDGFNVNRKNGSYILNPSKDLKSMQSTFEALLSSLDGWTGIVKREPQEDEFKEALETKDLCLYFGHGSGAQYIRGRTIKRLDHCAVTFLMGCSSGSLTETGQFEPYGTPMNYMHAGTPALVATLWDVTDKDIDRFAKTTFEQWGLLPTTETIAGTKEKNRHRKSRGVRSEQQSAVPVPIAGDEAVGLDTAVANSRNSCIMRYLNGAAPVIYGVPVFLK
ncbi:hypothetical protein AJ80_04280 [Polytolypa hystricis UAMH7299]|uniref:separase n=1 Tax=Polytolypa hystricis (strain UAMH7299) TaxID=1447883 RepID=A0A2B7YD44_POLH7|nr:hypothetical protein AJ80_04280 [Polytolypa hystricis UAMH7299]